ncbi:MAG: hydroxymethylbilane synthase [Candidatus Omnitrophota bacterium]
MQNFIKVGTRPSLLALAQVEIIKNLVPELDFEIAPIDTKGDKDKTRPLSLEEDTDFFTYEIEKALLNKEIDIAIHSAKDLEKNRLSELVIAYMTRPPDRRDSLVSSRDLKLDELPSNSVIGASSKNRKASILKYRDDLIVKDIRGNIDERLSQLDRGDFDAVIIAYIAMIRLDIKERVAQVIPFNIIQPHPLQGRIAVQVHKDNYDLIELFRGIDEE